MRVSSNYERYSFLVVLWGPLHGSLLILVVRFLWMVTESASSTFDSIPSVVWSHESSHLKREQKEHAYQFFVTVTSFNLNRHARFITNNI